MSISRAQRRQQERQQRKIERQSGQAPADTLDYIRSHFPPTDRLEELLERARKARSGTDHDEFFRIAERLLAAFPDSAETCIALAEAAQRKGYFALFISTLRSFCQNWPDHELAGSFAKALTAAEKVADQSGITTPIEVGAQQEWMLWFSETGQMERVRDLAREVLAKFPDDLPSLNNLTLAHLSLGEREEARDLADRALQIQPDNLHALANLLTCQVRLGAQAQAEKLAVRLKASKDPGFCRWPKMAEALSYLGDDQGVIDAYLGASQDEDPLLNHLAAVAWARKGDWKLAQKLWKKAAENGLEIARENLRNATLAPGLRHSPWAFQLCQWFNLKKQIAGRSAPKTDKALLQEFPELEALVPVMLDRGDPLATEFAVRMAHGAQNRQMLGSLKEFALSQRGTDPLRFRAAMACREADLLPASGVRLWQDGCWTELLLLSFTIHWEEGESLPKRVRNLKDKSADALRQGRYQEAEALIEKGLQQTPASPGLLNNLAVIYLHTGRDAQGRDLMRKIHQAAPYYPFATISLASLHIVAHEFAEARRLLNHVLQAQRIHVSEFASLCEAHLQLAEAEKDYQAAAMWVQAWQQLEDQDEEAERFRPSRL